MILSKLEIYDDIDLDVFDSVGYLLTPRKVIKASIQYKQVIGANHFVGFTDKSKYYLLGLILLYHIWPDFYEYLSGSSNPERTRGIFANFLNEKEGNVNEKISIPNKFQDSDLAFFIQEVFWRKFNAPGISIGDSNIVGGNKTITEIINALKDLGLP